MRVARHSFLQRAGALCMVAAFLLAAATAHADVRTEARRFFRQGMTLVSEGELDRGIAFLQQAYDTLPHPNVLYNIARAYAEAGRYEDSIEYFERYLDSDPPDREEVAGFLAAIRQRIEAQNARRDDAVQVAEGSEEGETQPAEELGPAATSEEIQALQDSATQIEALAEATQSDALRQRADRLRALAESLRHRNEIASSAGSGGGTTGGGTAGGGTAGGGTAGGGTAGAGGDPLDVPGGLELGDGADDDIYEERVVSASRFAQSPLDAPNATANITRQDVRLTGVGLVSIGELVRRVPGMDVMTLTPIDTQISARGFNQRLSNKMLVLVDGRSVYIDTLGTTFWSTLPFTAEDIERIEVIRGPASALYGADAFSGIINILTRPPGTEETSVTVGYGTDAWAHGHVAASGRLDRLGFRLAASYDHANAFSLEATRDRLDREHFRDPPHPELGFEAVALNGSLQYRLAEDVVAHLQGGVVDHDQQFQATGPLRQFRSTGPTTHVMGLVETPWGQVRAFWNRIDADAGADHFATGGDRIRSEFKHNTVDVEAELAREFDLLVHHNLHIGAGYRLKTINWGYLDGPHTENHYAVFFQDTMRIIDQLSIVGSFRTDFHPLLDGPVFSPRGALVVRPTEGSAIRASVGTAFRTPTFLESYLDLPNPTPLAGAIVTGQGSETAGIDLAPESILSAEIGYRNAESDFFDVEAAVYYNRVQDLIVLTQIEPYELHEFADPAGRAYDPAHAAFPVGTITFANEEPVYDVIGGELGARVYPVRGLDLYANYSINETFVDSQDDRDEERTSAHKINAGVQYRSTFGLDVGVDFHWVSDQVWVEPQFDVRRGVIPGEFPIDSYYLVNARVGYRLFEDKLELAVNGFNVTDHRHRQHPYGQLLSARYLATATYRF